VYSHFIKQSYSLYVLALFIDKFKKYLMCDIIMLLSVKSQQILSINLNKMLVNQMYDYITFYLINFFAGCNTFLIFHNFFKIYKLEIIS